MACPKRNPHDHRGLPGLLTAGSGASRTFPGTEQSPHKNDETLFYKAEPMASVLLPGPPRLFPDCVRAQQPWVSAEGQFLTGLAGDTFLTAEETYFLWGVHLPLHPCWSRAPAPCRLLGATRPPPAALHVLRPLLRNSGHTLHTDGEEGNRGRPCLEPSEVSSPH